MFFFFVVNLHVYLNVSFGAFGGQYEGYNDRYYFVDNFNDFFRYK